MQKYVGPIIDIPVALSYVPVSPFLRKRSATLYLTLNRHNQTSGNHQLETPKGWIKGTSQNTSSKMVFPVYRYCLVPSMQGEIEESFV